jgi:hypothetical protein
MYEVLADLEKYLTHKQMLLVMDLIAEIRRAAIEGRREDIEAGLAIIRAEIKKQNK